MDVMNWNQLLSIKRVKALWGEKSSTIIEGDPRSEFDRDFGRTVFSTPVRRLQDKAQVFPLEEHDAVRTRLTHSLEVSSVARSLGEAAERLALKKGGLSSTQSGCIQTIAATCGLIHDLGNPPFGHAGELAIADWFDKQERDDPKLFDDFDPKDGKRKARDTQFARDFLSFEGNAQTQRLLSRLQVLADDYGLNLTCGTLSASCKYVASSDSTDQSIQAKKKHGFFASENDLISRIRNEVGTGDARNPITFLVEASDDIVYSTIDLEDGIKKRCISWEFLEDELRKRCRSECLDRSLSKAKDKIDPAGFQGQTRDEAMAVGFRTFAIAEMVVATIRVFEAEYERIMAGDYPHEILYKSDAGSLAKACKSIALEHVYVSPEILKREIMGREILFDLLDLYWEAAQAVGPGKEPKGFNKKVYSQISSNYRQIFERNVARSEKLGIPVQYFRMQLITDQVSGMTDSFAVKLHRELKNA
jgi:dGTPase